MKNINVRNILLIIAAVIAVILGMNLLSTLVGAIIPIIITGIVGFALGRSTANRSLGDLVRTAQTAGSSVVTAASKMIEEKPATVTGSATTASAPAVQKPAAEKPAAAEPAPAAETPPLKNIELLDPDFEVKTPEQIQEEARRLESELTQKAAAYDPKAALEERKKRLLGNKGSE
ncbi:MAG: hypothetical protein J0L63_07390 [Anaerolineae bacterium]|nr:hypothetical protein [Anaerolineae bacterium]